jgi:hypothetical protein
VGSLGFCRRESYCARFSSVVDEDCVEAALGGAAAGAALAVSVVAGLAIEVLAAGGAVATDVSAVELGVEAMGLGAASVFNGARLSALIVAELRVAAFEVVLAVTLGDAFAGLAGSAGALGDLALLRLGVGAAAALASATLVGLSAAVAGTSAGAGALGAALPESALLATFVAGSGALTTLSLRL